LRVSSSANKRLRYSASTDGLLLGRVADDAKGTGSLSVETHVLGERLGQDGLVTLGDKVSQGKGVVVDVSRGETLVGLRKREKRVVMSASVVLTVSLVVSHHVEEGEVTLLLENVAELLPLLVSRVNTGRVVRATVIQRSEVNNGSWTAAAGCCTYACKRMIELLGAFCKLAAAHPHFDQPVAQPVCQRQRRACPPGCPSSCPQS
jgi:hypothetical protein